MKTEPLGDSALIIRELSIPAYQLAEAIEEARLPGVFEAVASYDTVGVYFDPSIFQIESLAYVEVNRSEPSVKLHEIPVCYEMGEDLPIIADALGLLTEEIIRLHCSPTYRCFAVGFCPGFPYLGYLPEALSGVPRRPSPRVRIEPGSVAIAGRQTGIYPIVRPGGWSILGRTPLCLVDVEDAYFPIRAGDSVRFTAIASSEYDLLKGKRL